MDKIEYTAAPSVDWRLPEEVSPPAGQMVQLLSIYGKATQGVWQGNVYWVAWAPFPKIPKHIKEKMEEMRKNYLKI